MEAQAVQGMQASPAPDAATAASKKPAGKAADAPVGYERFWDMPFGDVMQGEDPFEPRVPMGFARVAVGLVDVIVKTLFRFQVDGRENLGALVGRTGVVVASTHTSFLDVAFLYEAIRPIAWPRIIARNTLFDGKPRLAGWALSRVGVIPVHRDTADRTAIKRAAKFLKMGEVIAIMPEGTRRGKSGTEPELHGGAALIAKMGKAPILPMCVRNAEDIKRKGEPIRFPKVTAQFGNPVFVSDFDFLPKSKRLDGCIWYVMRECFALSQRKAPEDVDMQALFPKSEDFSQAFAAHPIPRLSSDDVAALFS